jgi:ParB/RepB/Spo0J family partition protein
LVKPDPDQPRKLFDPFSLEQLTSSIKATNFVEPLIVRENEEKPGTYIIVDGERRWRACKALNFSHITCCVISPTSLDYEIIALSQNIHRDDLTTMEKAVALAKIFSNKHSQNPRFQQKDLIPLVNLSESYISDLLKISKLEEGVKKEALESTAWTRSKLLQLANIKYSYVKANKFQELKDKIAKKHMMLEQVVTSMEDKISDRANGDDNKQIPSISPNEKKIMILEKHATIFFLKLLRIKIADIDPLELKGLKKVLTNISNLINELLSK